MALFFFFSALAIPFAIFVQSGAPYVAEKWTIPTLDTNFFSFSDPLHFFHFASHCFGFVGISVITVSVFHDQSQIYQGVTYILLSIGFLVGVKLCMRMCRRKYEK